MEAVTMLDSKFGVDAFDEGIQSMRKFYDCAWRDPIPHYVTDFENFYGDATINAHMLHVAF